MKVEPKAADKPRYRYTEVHRQVLPEQTYPSCLTDAECALVSDIFDNDGGRGFPPKVSRHTMVDACCYVARTGALGACCQSTSHIGRTSTAPSAVGPIKASLSKCTIVCVVNE